MTDKRTWKMFFHGGPTYVDPEFLKSHPNIIKGFENFQNNLKLKELSKKYKRSGSNASLRKTETWKQIKNFYDELRKFATHTTVHDKPEEDCDVLKAGQALAAYLKKSDIPIEPSSLQDLRKICDPLDSKFIIYLYEKSKTNHTGSAKLATDRYLSCLLSHFEIAQKRGPRPKTDP